MDVKYSLLDHGGLEPVERNDGMEVVPDASFRADRKSTLSSPQPAIPLDQTKEEHESYYMADTGSDATQTPNSDLGKPSYFNAEAGEAVSQSQHMQRRREGRRYCGMRTAVFIALLVAVALLVCLGAILGGVLGAMIPKKMAVYGEASYAS